MSVRGQACPEKGDDVPHEVVPVDYVFRHVVDGVLQVEPISVAEHRAVLAVLEADLVHAVTEGQVFAVRRKRIELVPAKQTQISKQDEPAEDKHTLAFSRLGSSQCICLPAAAR